MYSLSNIFSFFRDAISVTLKGTTAYYMWIAALVVVCGIGFSAYLTQLQDGLIVTGMTDHVSWGLYISNFTFLVGLAAAAVMIILPAYVLHDMDFSRAVLIGEGVAVSAVIMCLCFVVADMGSPERLWHMIPFIGYFNWPNSMLTWDTVVLNGYLVLNVSIPFYLLITKYNGQKAIEKYYVPFVFLSVIWAFSIHLVTAFLYSGLPAKPFWNSSLLGPRFLASAFAAGPAFIIVTLMLIRKYLKFEVKGDTINKLALIITVAAQVNLVMLGSEIFKEFYSTTEHSLSAIYMFFGLDGHNSLVPWLWFSVLSNLACTIALSIHKIRRNLRILTPICVILFVAIWIEKGMGLIVPGFIPTALGEIVEYSPSGIEILVTVGIWALGLLVLTTLVRVGISVEKGEMRSSN